MLLARSGKGYEATPNRRRRDRDLRLDRRRLHARDVRHRRAQIRALVAVLFVPGTILYVWARREQNARLFTQDRLIVFAVTLVAGLVRAFGLLTGTITP